MTPDIDVNKAMIITTILAKKYENAWLALRRDPSCSVEHLVGMKDRWLAGDNSPKPMSNDKKMRWLGWMQGVLVSMAFPHVCLDDMAQLNKSCGPFDEKSRDYSAWEYQQLTSSVRRVLNENFHEVNLAIDGYFHAYLTLADALSSNHSQNFGPDYLESEMISCLYDEIESIKSARSKVV